MRYGQVLLLAGCLTFGPSVTLADPSHDTVQEPRKQKGSKHEGKSRAPRHGEGHHEQPGQGHKKHAQEDPRHPHGGPPGHQKRRGRGHHKHAELDADHPHGGPPGHRKHHEPAEAAPPQKLLDAILGE